MVALPVAESPALPTLFHWSHLWNEEYQAIHAATLAAVVASQNTDRPEQRCAKPVQGDFAWYVLDLCFLLLGEVDGIPQHNYPGAPPLEG